MTAISAREASAIILDNIPVLAVETVPLLAALGSVAAERVLASVNMPPWRAASMDGYAVRASDVEVVPTHLRVVGEVVAGTRYDSELTAGQAARIMTGAPVPDGADTVVRVEDTTSSNDSVEIRLARDSRRNVRPLGEDFHTGDTLTEPGDVMTPARIGVLASAGTSALDVHRRPTVAIITSGDELVTIDGFDDVRAGDRVVSSSSYALPALVRSAGAAPADYGIVADDPVALRERVYAALTCDLVLTTGGVSVGDRDFTRSVMAEAGVDMKFWRTRVRPGGPIAFGVIEGRPWIGLPGNPVSAMVTFELFVRPALLKMSGHRRLFPVPFDVTLAEPVTVTGDLTHFLRVTLEHDGMRYTANLTGTQSSGALTSMARADALLIVPEGKQRWETGEVLKAIPIDGSGPRTSRFVA